MYSVSACLILMTISNIQHKIQDRLRGSTAAVESHYNECYERNRVLRARYSMTNTGIIRLVMSGNYDVADS